MHHGGALLAPAKAGGERRGGGRHRQAVGGREEYCARELATDHEQYLSGHGESPGHWYGAAATRGILHGCLARRVTYQEQVAWPAG